MLRPEEGRAGSYLAAKSLSMDFWACAEEADRLWSGPGEKHSAGGKTRCYRGAKGSRVKVLGHEVVCLAAESLAKPFLSPCLVFPTWIITFPHFSGGDLYQQPHQAPSFAPQNESGPVFTSLILGHKFFLNSPKLSRSPNHRLDAAAPSASSSFPTYRHTAALPGRGGWGAGG